MPHIDLERLTLNYSYHIIFCIAFAIGAALTSYIGYYSVHNIAKFKLTLIQALRYKLRAKKYF